MRVNREELLRCLESVSAGLSQQEVIEQSSCFVFENGLVTTFNDEVTVSTKAPVLGIVGAVPSQPLLNLLSRLAEDELDIESTEQEMLVKGKGRRASIRIESDIALSVESVSVPSEWKPLDPNFGEAVGIVQLCASKDDSSFVLTCVHITPNFVEACDNLQLARYPIKTGMEESCLVRRDALAAMQGLGMTEIGYTDSWLSFRNDAGLVLSCRRWVEDYDDLTDILEVNGAKAVLPPGLVEAVSKAEVFSSVGSDSNEVRIELKENKLRLRGEGSFGWYEERKQVQYTGEPISFLISPELLGKIVKLTNECVIVPGRLKIDAGKFVYVACLGEVK